MREIEHKTGAAQQVAAACGQGTIYPIIKEVGFEFSHITQLRSTTLLASFYTSNGDMIDLVEAGKR